MVDRIVTKKKKECGCTCTVLISYELWTYTVFGQTQEPLSWPELIARNYSITILLL